MKIAYFNANLRMGQDGVTRCVYQMINAALEKGHRAIAVTSTLPDGRPPIPIYKVPSIVLPLQKNYRIALPGYTSFSEILDQFKPDILHINSPCTLGFAAARYGRQRKIPVVATYHTHFPSYPRYYNLNGLEELTWWLLRQLYSSVDRTFVPTMPILGELRERNIKRIEYLPNGVDTLKFNPGYRSSEWRKRFGGGEKPILLFVSRLVWEKDLRVLADAYRALLSKRNDFEMVIVGEGHARDEFEQMMPGAHFLGYQSGRTLSESFASSDIFAFPSTTETFGLVTLEAMASGAVPVAANVGGAAEIVQHGQSGLLSEPRNAGDMMKSIDWLLDHPDFYRMMRENAIERSHAYRWEHILDRLFWHYDDVAKTVHPIFRKVA